MLISPNLNLRYLSGITVFKHNTIILNKTQKNLRFIHRVFVDFAVRPWLMSPTVAARMAVTFDRLSGSRLLINVVTGGDPVELAYVAKSRELFAIKFI